ncbi:MAG TPA: (2Fe-2S)-binding protein [Acidimicrobiia bacterium]|nr:(2Fe-2S)-binding protein [Acidimicrobiia bacterium]
MTDVTLTTQINGRPQTATIAPRLSLAEFLRDGLGLTGTKLSCEMQVCGACTVLVDGLPVSSCNYLAADVDGREVLTIEGLATGPELHPIQKAFIDKFAMQCGYCTPGFVMMTKALLDEVADPSTDEIADHFEANICRCTGYQPIVAAVREAASLIREDR